MNPNSNAPDASSNPPKTNQFEGISMADSTFVPQRSTIRARLEDRPQGSQNDLEENAEGEVRGKDSKDMSVSQIQQDVGRKLKMRPAPDEFENKLLQSSDIGESVDTLKKLVRDSNINGDAENDILEDLDNLQANLGASDVNDQLIIRKASLETRIELKNSEKEQLIEKDFELETELKNIEEDIDNINDDIKDQRRTSEGEKDVLKANIARLENELQSLQIFEAALNNLVRETEDAKNIDANENNRIKSDIDNSRAEQQRIANSLKDVRIQRRDAKDREYDVSQEIEGLQEKLNSLKDLEAKLTEIMQQFEKITAKIQEGEGNIGELNKKCKDAKDAYNKERKLFETEKANQENERKELEKQKEELEKFVRENQGILDDDKSPKTLAEDAQRRQEERALFDQRAKSTNYVAKTLNEKEEMYKKWREDLESRTIEPKRINELKEELKQEIEEAKALEGSYKRLEKEYNNKKESVDEVTLSFQLQKKEKLKELNQKLEDARNELAWGQKRRTGPFANFCVAFVNTGLVGLLLFGVLHLSNITVPGFESI